MTVRRTTEKTGALLDAAQRGSRRALEEFFERELPPLRRFAHARVPRWMHSRNDPDDFVQRAALRMLRRLHHLDPRRHETVQPYLRQTLLNLVRDEIRAAGRSPELPGTIDEPSCEMDAADRLYARDTHRAYTRALARLSPKARACVIARVEKGLGYEEMAASVGCASPGAARVALTRALQALANEMKVSASDSRSGRRARRTSRQAAPASRTKPRPRR